MDSLASASAADGAPSTVPLATTFPFERLCRVLERLGGLKHKQKEAALTTLIQAWAEHDLPPPRRDIYALIRLMLPELDTQRVAYGVKEKAMAKYYISAIGVAPDSEAARKLINWKNSKFVQSAGDFAAVVHEVLERRANPTGPKWTIADVNVELDRLIESSATGKHAHVDIFRKFVTRMSALENKWIVKIILKTMKIGVSEERILRSLHPDAMEVYNTTSDLAKVCRELTDPTQPSPEKQIALFRPFRPMLAGRDAVEKTMELLGNQPFYAELKLDGERIQLHKDGDKYFYCSRKKKDYTRLYGASPMSRGALTRFIHDKCFSPLVRNVILDGEMVTIDKNGSYGRFGNLKTAALAGAGVGGAGDDDNDDEGGRPSTGGRRRRAKDDDDDNDDDENGPAVLPELDESETVCFVVFDLLYLNDVCLTSRPLHERKDLLSRYITPFSPHLHVMKHVEIKSMNELYDQINRVIETKQEGLVAKRIDSPYAVNKREKEMWVKIKPEYLDSTGDDLDVLIVAGFWSDGRRRGGKITHFMCAVLDDKAGPGAGAGAGTGASAGSMPLSGSLSASVDAVGVPTPGYRFLTFNKFGSGVSDQTLEMLTQKLHRHWKPWDNARPPKWLSHPSAAEKPDLYIEPQHSIVVQIKAAEIVPSTQYGCGYTLRFPRLVRLRDDKGWQDVLKLEEMHEMRLLNQGRLISRKAYQDAAGDRASKRRKVERPPRRGRAEIAAHLRGANLGKVVASGTLFKDKLIYVANVQPDAGAPSQPERTKESVEVLIAEQSGGIVQSVRDNLFCVVADESQKAKVVNVIRMGEFDVVRSQWVFDCIAQTALLALQPQYMLSAKPSTAQRFARRLDPHGDSYAVDVTSDQLLQILGRMPADGAAVDTEASRQLKRRYAFLRGDAEWGLFEQLDVVAIARELGGQGPASLRQARQEIALAKFVTRGATVLPSVVTLPADADDAAAILSTVLDDHAFEPTHVLLETGTDDEREWAVRVLGRAMGERPAGRLQLVDAAWVAAAVDVGQL